MSKKPQKDLWDRIIVFHSAQVENEVYARRLAAKAAAFGSEDELRAEADRMVDHYFGAYPSEEPEEWEGDDPGETARIEAGMREYHGDVILRLRETDCYAWGLAVAGIMHLWERTVKGSLQALIKPTPSPKNLGKLDFKRLCDSVEATGYAIRQAGEYPDLERSMIVANATKHGEGDAMDKLLAAAPGLFVGGTDPEHLRIGRADFDRAVAAVDKFWPRYEDAWVEWRDQQAALDSHPSISDDLVEG